jgi:hypothetical protein
MMHLVMQMSNADDQSLKAITVRVPEAAYDWLRQYATRNKVSLNSVVAEAVTEYTTKIQRAGVIRDIRNSHQNLRRTRCDLGETDSVQDLREVRVSNSLQDVSPADSGKPPRGREGEDSYQ